MKRFNVNDYIYVQIRPEGWTHLEKTVGIDYINSCIKTPCYTHVIDGETWYQIQCWVCFELLFHSRSSPLLFNPNIMLDEKSLE